MDDEGGNNNRVSSSSSSSSKRLLLMADDDRSVSSSSSVHAVVFNDDLLIEILLRLPAISLFFFKSVSKRWLSLITSPEFFNLHVTLFPNIPPPSGLFLQELSSKRDPSERDHFEHDFVSLDTRIPSGKNKISSAFTFGCFGIDASDVEVLQSCNGLVLCVVNEYPADKIYVYNPCINMLKMLPQVDGLKYKSLLGQTRLAFDPAKSRHFKVLHIRLTPPDPQRRASILTWIYSSETGCWRKGGYSFPIEWFIWEFDSGVYWNDALHWLDLPNLVRHFKLDVEHPPDTTTELPKTLNSSYNNKLFESRGCLLLACAEPVYPNPLEIYEMRNGYSGRSLKYTVKYEDGIAAFLQTWKMSPVGFRFNVLFIVVGEREEESVVVLNLNGKVVKYNLLSKTLHMRCDIKTHLTKFCTFPFIASFACV